MAAWRNVWRNRRRTLIVTAAIAFSVAISIFQASLSDGSYKEIIRNTIESFPGYIQIHRAGYQDDPSVEKCFPVTPEIIQAIKGTPGVTGFTPRLITGALVGNSRSSTGAMVVGVDPAGEKLLSATPRKIFQGSYLSGGGGKECVIGHRLSVNMEAPPGSDIVVITQGIDGSTGALRFRVSGVFRTGLPDIDESMVFIPLEQARDLLQAPGMAHAIVVGAKDPDGVEPILAGLKKALPGSGFEVLGWRELLPGLVQFINLDRIFDNIFVLLLLLVVTFGVLSAVFSSVLERIREFGVMMALGTRPSQVVLLVMLETLVLVGLGIVTGTLIGLGVSVYVIYNPINLPSDTETIMSYYGMENKLRASINPGRTAGVAAVVAGLSLLFSLYPAWKASSLRPDRAMRNID
jgi:ABC-type lipoprotein release transport system permease subunit